MPSLSPSEKERYSRQLLIDSFTEEEQQKIKKAKVLVIGAGGLGSPVLLYLTAAGVGTIGIVEFDTVDLSNLNRQVLYASSDIGAEKAKLLSDPLIALNPNCTILTIAEKWGVDNALSIATDYDIIVDCTDNYETRYLSDEISRKLSIPMIYGAIYQMEGQVAVFNYKGSKSYSDLFPKSAEAHYQKAGGVIGPIAGVIGSMQAAEALKIITGLGEVLANKMFTISLKYNRSKLVDF